jgi:hypothetical protein
MACFLPENTNAKQTMALLSASQKLDFVFGGVRCLHCFSLSSQQYESPSHNYAAPSSTSNETLSKEICRQARILARLAAANVSPSSIIPRRLDA